MLRHRARVARAECGDYVRLHALWYVSVHCTLRNPVALATSVGPSGYTSSRNDSMLYVAIDTGYSMLESVPNTPPKSTDAVTNSSAASQPALTVNLRPSNVAHVGLLELNEVRMSVLKTRVLSSAFRAADGINKVNLDRERGRRRHVDPAGRRQVALRSQSHPRSSGPGLLRRCSTHMRAAHAHSLWLGKLQEDLRERLSWWTTARRPLCQQQRAAFTHRIWAHSHRPSLPVVVALGRKKQAGRTQVGQVEQRGRHEHVLSESVATWLGSGLGLGLGLGFRVRLTLRLRTG